MNSLGRLLDGEVVVLQAMAMAPDYRDLRYRVVQVTGGPGASPMTAASWITCRSVLTGQAMQINANLIERLATVADLSAAGRR